MHKLLAEQIHRFLGSFQDLPEEVRSLLRDVDRIYRQADLLGLNVEKLAAHIQIGDEEEIPAPELFAGPEEGANFRTPAIFGAIDAALLGLRSPFETACALVEQLATGFELSGAVVTIPDYQTGEMVRRYERVLNGDTSILEQRYFMDGGMRSALREGKLLLIDKSSPPSTSQDVQQWLGGGFGGVLRAPAVVRDHLVAVLDLLSVEENTFSVDLMQAAREAAGHVALAVQQSALLGEVTRLSDTLEERIIERTAFLEKQAKDISLLNDMGEQLQSCTKVEEAYDVIQEHMPRIFPELQGALAVVSEAGESFTFIRSWGLAIDTAQSFPIEKCWGMRRGQLHMVEPNQGGLVCQHVEKPRDMFSERTLLCIPLSSQDGTIGLLHLRKEVILGSGELGDGASVSLAVQQLALTVGEQVGLALANLSLQESLRIQAIRDPITGLFNRRYMEESLEREMQRSIRNGSFLGVIMLDIDHFKAFNDKYGHAVGDALLRELGAFLQERVRKEDIACKYGGEEFVLIMPNADLNITADRAESIRREVKNLHVEHDGKIFENITLSLGVSIFPTHGRNVDDVLKIADNALYQAKEGGRDRVVVAGGESVEGGKSRRN